MVTNNTPDDIPVLTKREQAAPTSNQSPSALPNRRGNTAKKRRNPYLNNTTRERLHQNADVLISYCGHLVTAALEGDRKELLLTFDEIQDLMFRACHMREQERHFVAQRIREKTLTLKARDE